MIQRVYERVSSATPIQETFVATDDHRICTLVESFGGKAVMTRDNNRSGTDRVAEAAEIIGLNAGDLIVNVQGDQPLFDPRCISQLIQPFGVSPQPVMSTLAFRIEDRAEIVNPKDVKVTFDSRGDALYFSRSPIPCGRDSDEGYTVYKHLGFYAYTREFLDIFRKLPTGRLEEIEKLEQLRAMEFGFKIRVVLTEYDSPEVDIPSDLDRIERVIQKTGS